MPHYGGRIPPVPSIRFHTISPESHTEIAASPVCFRLKGLVTHRIHPANPRRTLHLCAAAALCLLPAAPMLAQISAVPAQVALQSLHIDILEGEGALNNIRQRDAREPAVQVTDENHKPVAGAVILFTVHSGPQGAGATFGDAQSLTFSATTGPDGIAHAPTLHLAKSPGSYTIEVSAAVGALVASAIIHQSNVIGALDSTSSNASNSATVHHSILGMSKTVAITVGSVVVVGVVVGVVQATKSNGTSLTLGQSSIGP